MTVLEIKPHRRGWRIFEAPDVEPVFPQKRQAIDYAETRVCFRSSEIRILDSTGKVERTIAFSESPPAAGFYASQRIPGTRACRFASIRLRCGTRSSITDIIILIRSARSILSVA